MVKESILSITIILSSILSTSQATELNIATVNNGHMIEMQKLSRKFEIIYPDIKLNWHVFNEGSLRMRVIADIASGSNHYDVMTIGMYETSIWAKRDWLIEIKPKSSYQIDDLLPAIRDGLSYENKLYAAPFYGESSLIIYNKDLVENTGMEIKDRPKWDYVEKLAKAIHNPSKGIYGICLRGKPGWGDNIALISTIVNSYGGQWFDMNWQPQINSKPWKKAVSFYVNLLKKYGPTNPEQNSFNELLQFMKNGQCGMWIDASIAGSFVSDPKNSKFAKRIAFAQSPVKVTDRGANWLWAWALAIPKGTKKMEAAQQFVAWATSKQYVELVAEHNGWANVPTGTRKSTYNNPNFLQFAEKFAKAEFEALNSAEYKNNTLQPSPYKEIQFVSIPEFISIGGITGQKISEALEGKISVEKALNSAQKYAEREMRRAGYYE